MEITLENAPELWSCRNCTSGFAQNTVSEQDASALYDQGIGGERWANKKIKETKNAEIIWLLEGILKNNRRVLDIGCNTGELLDFAKEKGCITSGVEFCRTSREILAKKGHGFFPSINDVDDSYDVITAFDLVEHLYNFPQFLEFCGKKLIKGGLLVILTGNISSLSARIAGANWWYLKYPEHIVFLSKRYFQSLPGFRIEQTVPTYASVGYKHSFLSRGKGFIKGLLKGNYQGLPSLGPDHLLVVLKK